MSEKYKLEVIDMPHEQVSSHLNLVQGKVLTFIDALLPEGTQNKSAKDTVKTFFRYELSEIWRYTHPKVRQLSDAEMEILKMPAEETFGEVDVVEVPLKK